MPFVSFGVGSATALLALVLGSGQAVQAQAASPPAPSPAEVSAGVQLTCAVSCSEVELRTGLARLTWRLVPGPRLDALAGRSLAGASQRLETTVFRDGFAQKNFVTLPVAESQRDRLPEQPAALARPAGLRAYQIQLVEIDRPEVAARFDSGAAEAAAVVEGLEPGVRYTWRLVIDAGGTELVSPEISCRAPICPADEAGEVKP